MTQIIRLPLVVLGVLAVSACIFNPSPNTRTASAPRQNVTELPKTPGTSANSVWVLSPLGLNVRGAPDPQSAKVTSLAQSARLTVSERQTAGSDTWLHVKTETGQFEGWVLDRPDLVIHRAVSLHVESSAGYSILFPAEWSPASGNPATFTGGTDANGGSMLVQTDADPTKLAATPMSPGKELRQESPIEVYGRTTYLTVYQLDSGGYEFDVKLQFPKTKAAYLFDFKQAGGAAPDTSLFKQLLGSVIVPGEA